MSADNATLQEEETLYEFQANTSSKHLERMRIAREEAGIYGVHLQVWLTPASHTSNADRARC